MAIRYLLGTLSEDEKASLEEQYFLDDTEFEQLELAEDELIDRYVRAELSSEEAHKFEKLLISPRISERVEVARILAQRTVSLPQKQPTPIPEISSARAERRRAKWWENLFGPAAVATSAFRPAMAFAMIFMVLTTVALIFIWTKLHTQSQRLAQEQQQRDILNSQIKEHEAKYNNLEAELKQTRQEKEEQHQQLVERYEQLLAEQRQRPTPALSFPFFLSPEGGTRSGGASSVQAFTIPRGFSTITINLNVTHGDYARYNAFVQNIDRRKEVAKGTNLKPVPREGRKYIALKVDTKRLPPGSYSIRVNGIKPTGEDENFDDYLFQVRGVSR